MNIDDLKKQDLLRRPESNNRTIADGAYIGKTVFVELVERDSHYTENGKRVVLNIKFEVEDHDGKIVDLYLSPSLSWSKKGKMLPLLDKLGVLPEPGESMDLDELVGIHVQVIVENNEKDGMTYSNIISVKRIEKNQTNTIVKKKPLKKPLQSNGKSKLKKLGRDKPISKDEVEDLLGKEDTDDEDFDFDEFFGVE